MRFLILVTFVGCGTASVQYDGSNDDIIDRQTNIIVSELKVVDGHGAVIGDLLDIYTQNYVQVYRILHKTGGVLVNLNPVNGFFFGEPTIDRNFYGSSDCRGNWKVAYQVPEELCHPFPLRTVVGGTIWNASDLFVYGEKVKWMKSWEEVDGVGCVNTQESCMVELVPVPFERKVELPITLD